MGAGYGRARNTDVKMGEQRHDHGLKRKRDDFDEDLENTDDEQSAMGFDAEDDDSLHDGGLTNRGGSGKEFILDAPRLKARSSDDMTITWRVHRDPRTRDVRDVTCYKVEMRSVYGDWVTPSDSVVIVAPSELGQPFRDIKRKLLRDKTFIHPGTSVEIRVRAVRGPRRGLTSPTLRTRFLDGPIEIWRPLPACLMDKVRDTNEVTGGLRRLSVHSGATIGSLRETFKVADCERLVVAASRVAHAQLSRGRPTIEGVPIDHCSPTTKLRDIIELQPWHWSLGSGPSVAKADQPQQPQPRFIYTSPPGRTQDSFPVAIYLANGSKLQTATPPALLPGEALPFPCWLELSPDSASVGDIKARLVTFFAEKGVSREAANLAHLTPDELLLYTPSGRQLEDGNVIGAHHPLAWGATPTLLLDFKPPASFDLTVVDASNHVASVSVADTTTLGDVARTLQLDVDLMTSILKLSLPQVNASTTLRALGFSPLFWLLHGGRRAHDGEGEIEHDYFYHIGVGMQGNEQSRAAPVHYAKVTVEVFPDVITDNIRIFRIQPDTSLETLERLVQTAFWHLRPAYDVRLETSLRKRPPQDPVSMHLNLRGLCDGEVPGGGQGYCLRAIARPSEWRDERTQ